MFLHVTCSARNSADGLLQRHTSCSDPLPRAAPAPGAPRTCEQGKQTSHAAPCTGTDGRCCTALLNAWHLVCWLCMNKRWLSQQVQHSFLVAEGKRCCCQMDTNPQHETPLRTRRVCCTKSHMVRYVYSCCLTCTRKSCRKSLKPLTSLSRPLSTTYAPRHPGASPGGGPATRDRSCNLLYS